MVDLTANKHIYVTPQTSLSTLKSLTDKMQDGDKLRSTTIEGRKVLYIKQGKSSGVAKFFGVASRRREAAQKLVKNVIQRNTGGLAKSVLGHPSLSSKQTLSKADATALVKVATTASNLLSKAEGPSAPPRLNTVLGNPAAENLVNQIAKDILEKKDAATISQTLKQALTGPLANDNAFATRTLPSLRRDLFVGIGHALGKLGDTPSSHAKTKALDVVNLALEQLAKEKLGFTASPTDKAITLQNNSYSHESDIAQGGFGKVTLLKNDNSNERIALKISIPKDDQDVENQLSIDPNYAQTGIAEEFARHMEAQGNPPHPNILQVKGLVDFGAGRMGVAMEYAPHGDANGVAARLNAPNNNIPAQDKKNIALTLVKDMATGMADMHQRNVIHGDFKLPNVFIGQNGEAKIADFGTAQGGGSYKLIDSTPVDNRLYLSPEALRQQDLVISLRVEKQKSQAKTGLENDFKALYGDNTETKILKDLTKPVDSFLDRSVVQQALTNKEAVSLGPSNDVWALGLAALQLLTGENLMPPNTSDFTFGDMLKNFQNGVAIGQGGVLRPDVTTGDLALDALINRMLDPDPNNRPTMAQVLQDPLLQNQALGSQQVRTFLMT